MHVFDTTLCRITGDDSRIKEATQYSLAMGSSLKSIFDAENLVLATFPDWGQESSVETKAIEVSLIPLFLFVVLVLVLSSASLPKQFGSFFFLILFKVLYYEPHTHIINSHFIY